MPKACFAKEVRLELIQTPANNEGRKELYKIEHKFGEAKQGHGLDRCRYLGLAGFGFQAHFTAIVLNLKQIVKQATGVGLKTHSALMANQRRNKSQREGPKALRRVLFVYFSTTSFAPFRTISGFKNGCLVVKVQVFAVESLNLTDCRT